jgi:hypothetical protein
MQSVSMIAPGEGMQLASKIPSPTSVYFLFLIPTPSSLIHRWTSVFTAIRPPSSNLTLSPTNLVSKPSINNMEAAARAN